MWRREGVRVGWALMRARVFWRLGLVWGLGLVVVDGGGGDRDCDLDLGVEMGLVEGRVVFVCFMTVVMLVRDLGRCFLCMIDTLERGGCGFDCDVDQLIMVAIWVGRVLRGQAWPGVMR